MNSLKVDLTGREVRALYAVLRFPTADLLEGRGPWFLGTLLRLAGEVEQWIPDGEGEEVTAKFSLSRHEEMTLVAALSHEVAERAANRRPDRGFEEDVASVLGKVAGYLEAREAAARFPVGTCMT